MTTPAQPLPFAHPFFTATPPEDRRPDPRFAGARRMRDAVKSDFEPVPVLLDDPIWTLGDVIGNDRAKGIQDSGRLSFHSGGDSGAGKFPIDKHQVAHFGETTPDVEESQIAVAKAMNDDLNASHPASSPAFFFHLGDVIYFNNTPAGYHEQFYVPYQEYGGKIIAIPGNHDGEVFLGNQKSTLVEFIKNFCPADPGVPPDASPVIREMSAQPGVFWWLKAPFVDIVALYSNCGEGPGAIRGSIPGDDMFDWFLSALKRVKQSRDAGERRALIVATHHPGVTAAMFTASDGHSPSEEMRHDMDEAFEKEGIFPDLVLSAHDHNYQRFTRRHRGRDITYVVAGGMGRKAQQIPAANGQVVGEFKYENSHSGHGYLLISAQEGQLHFDYKPVPGPDRRHGDKLTIPLH
jgi:hypothetical protein